MEQIELKNRGVVFDAPTDVQLSDHDVIQPDIIVILNRDANIITPTKIKGVPDLVIEILSPSTRKNDMERKFKLYCTSGIPEYWIVDPEEQRILQYVLSDDSYELANTQQDQIEPQNISDVSVDLKNKVW